MKPTIPELSIEEQHEYTAFKIRLTNLVDIFGPFKTSVWITGSAAKESERKLHLKISHGKNILYEAWQLIDRNFTDNAIRIACHEIERNFINGSIRYFLNKMAEYSELQRQVFKHNQITGR